MRLFPFNVDLQKDALAQAGCDRVFEDRKSAARADRPGLREALDDAREGATLTVWRLGRLSRSLKDLIKVGGAGDQNITCRLVAGLGIEGRAVDARPAMAQGRHTKTFPPPNR